MSLSLRVDEYVVNFARPEEARGQPNVVGAEIEEDCVLLISVKAPIGPIIAEQMGREDVEALFLWLGRALGYEERKT